jgi:transcriptional regulator with PAS, ATPase and Fis domain
VLVSLVRRYEAVPWLDQMRLLVRRWWGVDSIYVDKTTHPIFLSGQPNKLANRVCAICLSSDRGRPLCLDAMGAAQQEAARLAQPTGVLCSGCHLGMTTLVHPIHIDGRFSGMIYTTGFFVSEPGEPVAALDRGATINPALGNEEVYASVPVLSADEVEHMEALVGLGVAAIDTLYGQLRVQEQEIAALRRELEVRRGYAGLVGSSSAMQEVYGLVERVADNDCTVLVRGESGTGKELVAQAIHSQSRRSERSFVVQNCSAFNDNLLDSELFGHVRGAFTGAVSDKKGLFEVADGGTLFLDEVAEMSPALQAKLLRVLQDGTFLPVGATTPRRSDVRIVAATHRDLEKMVSSEAFREDLYYRLNVISIRLPPLRERRGDIPALAKHFLARHGAVVISQEALQLLVQYDWPGNVRELANEIERMTVMAGTETTLGPEVVSSRIQQAGRASHAPQLAQGTLREALQSLEKSMIHSALQTCDGNRSRAAKLLGIARSNLLVKIKAYGLG